MRLFWKNVTFLQDQTGPMCEDAVHVMCPGFSFLTFDPEQVEDGEGVLEEEDPDGGGVWGPLLVDGAASVTASTPSIVISRSVLVE